MTAPSTSAAPPTPSEPSTLAAPLRLAEPSRLPVRDFVRRAVSLLALTLLAAACSQSSSDAQMAASSDLSDSDTEASGSGGEGSGLLEVEPEPVPVRPEVVIPSSWDSEIEEVYNRYWLYWDAFAAAHALPFADPTFGPLRELSTDENWESLSDQLADFARDGLVLVLPEASITEHLVRMPSTAVLTGEEGAEIVLQDCWIDDFVQQTVDGQTVLETREAKLMNVTMTVVEGQWLVDGVARATPESDGYQECKDLLTQ